MTGLLADHNVEGHVDRLINVLIAAGYDEIWCSLGLTVESCRSLGLPETIDDRSIWTLCQERGLSLITANRNNDGDSSLEAAIRNGGPADLPVYTLGDADRIMNDSGYALAAGISLLEYFLDCESNPESVLGCGRLFLPKNPV